MLHWLHHIWFDPLSAWEKFKLDMLGSACFIGLIVALWFFFIAIDMMKRKKKS